MSLQFKKDILRQNKVTYNHGRIVYCLNDCLLESIKLTKNSDLDKYQYGRYGLCFDSRGTYILLDGSYAKNLIIFSCDLSSSVHENNRANSVLTLAPNIVQKINDTTLYAENILKTICTVTNKTFVLSLHYNDDKCYLFVSGIEQTKSKAKDSEINPYQLSLGNSSEDFSDSDIIKTGLNGTVYYFSVDYSAISSNKIHDIYAYLMKHIV